MKTPSMTSHRLGRADFLHLRGQPVRLAAVHGTLWVTQDGEPDDVQIDPGQAHDFDGHAPLTIGSIGGEACARVTPLRATAHPGLAQWFGHLFAGARA